MRMHTELLAVTFEPNYYLLGKTEGGAQSAESTNMLKAAINADLSANTGTLRWQGARTQRLQVYRGWA